MINRIISGLISMCETNRFARALANSRQCSSVIYDETSNHSGRARRSEFRDELEVQAVLYGYSINRSWTFFTRIVPIAQTRNVHYRRHPYILYAN
jgi:hypothetical protein